ncbi:MAG: tetratricopeptide repeat protein [Acidobacteriota bacterium]
MRDSPDAIGPYRILRRLGGGGMGVVYLAEHPETSRCVALKTVKAPAAWLAAAIRREIHALARLRHPGIVRILDSGLEDGAPWYAMELVPGMTLRAHRCWARPSSSTRTEALTSGGTVIGANLSTERLAPDVATGDVPSAAADGARDAGSMEEGLRILRRLCATLAFLHGEGVVHGDLKPENVLIQPDGAPVIMDFGLASRFQDDAARESLADPTYGIGTYAYMAPEQVLAQPIDARADLYAVGCMLYELACGRTPFHGTTPREVARGHVDASPIPPRQLASGIPEDLDRLILALLAKEPRDRIGHAGVVGVALAALAPGPEDPVAVPPRSYLYRAGFFGREDGLAEMEGALDMAERGVHLHLVGGVSGVGKTRLLMAFAARAHQRRIRVLHSGAKQAASAAPLDALGGILAAILDHHRERPIAPEDRRLVRRLTVLSSCVPELVRLPGMDRAPDLEALPAEEARARLFAAVGESVRELCGGAPVVALVDDLQWADELSIDLLSYLVRTERVRDVPILVVGTYREEERAGGIDLLLSTPGVSSGRIGRLPDGALAEIVADMMASRPAPAGLVAFLSRHAEGNPFFAAEYLRVAVSQGTIVRDGAGHWRASEGGRYDDLTVPGSIRDVVRLRLAGLGHEARRIADASCVLGRESDALLVEEVAGLSPEATAAGIAELAARQVLEAGRAGRVAFLHDKLHEVCYAELALEDRRALHLAAARAIETRGGDDAPALLAHHWHVAGDSERAKGHYLRAARQGRERHAIAQAERFYREYLGLATEPAPEVADAWNEMGGDVLFPLGQLRQAAEAHVRSVEVARTLADRAREASGLARLGTVRARLGEYEPARQAFEEALSLHRALGDRKGEATALRGLGAALADQGRLVESIPLFEAAHGILLAMGDRAAQGIALTSLALAWDQSGRGRNALAAFEEALAIHRDVGSERHTAITLGSLARVLSANGRDAEVLPLIDEAIEILERLGDRGGHATALANKALHLVQGGRTDEGIATLRQAIALFAETDEARLLASARANLAVFLADAGHLDEADREFAEAVGSLERTGESRRLADVLARWATTRRRAGDASAAREMAKRALALVSAVSYRRGEVLVESELGYVALATGDVAAARERLAKARTIASELDLPKHDPATAWWQGLELAMRALDEGRASEVYQGEHESDYPDGLLALLRERTSERPS